VLIGPIHPVTAALADAVADPAKANLALRMIEIVPALSRRRLLAYFAALR
jgi:hypothetical protein